MAAKRFTVELERVGQTATMFRVPFRPEGCVRAPAPTGARDERVREGKAHR